MTNNSSAVLEITDTDLSALPEEFNCELKKKFEMIKAISKAFEERLITVDMTAAKIFTRILDQNYKELRALFEKNITPIANPADAFDDSYTADTSKPLTILTDKGQFKPATALLSNKLRRMVHQLNSVEPIISVRLPIYIGPQMPKVYEAFTSLREGFSALAQACTL